MELGIETELIGMRSIKEARLGKPVKCYPDTKVGEYVPFYFCHRSVMLYILYKGNHPELSYRGGQEPIVHLVSDLHAAVTWANSDGRKWAFTDCNARAEYAGFFKRLADLDKLNWQAVGATDFRDPVVKDGKQAEFLVYESFPWQLVEKIGVLNRSIETEANSILTQSTHKPI